LRIIFNISINKRQARNIIFSTYIKMKFPHEKDKVHFLDLSMENNKYWILSKIRKNESFLKKKKNKS
jgi:hypothetical protein